MGAADLPPEKPKVSEVRRANSSTQSQLNKLMEKIQKNATATAAGATMSNEGQISSMPIPAGWSKSSVDQHPTTTSNYVEYHQDKTSEARLGTYYRGHRISETAAKNFSKILKAATHTLDENEFLSLAEVLRDKSNASDFETTNKATIDIHGKRVLLIEGRFKEIKQKAYAIYVDAENTGEVIQEIFYQAPDSVFNSYKKAAEDSIKSITWK